MESLAQRKRRRQKPKPLRSQSKEKRVKMENQSQRRRSLKSSQDTSWLMRLLKSQASITTRCQDSVHILLLSSSTNPASQRKLSMRQSLTLWRLKINALSRIKKEENLRIYRLRRSKNSKIMKKMLVKNSKERKELGKRLPTNHSRQKRSNTQFAWIPWDKIENTLKKKSLPL